LSSSPPAAANNSLPASTDTPAPIDPDFGTALDSVLTATGDATSTATTAITQIGDLAKLGLCHWTPVGAAEALLEAVYITTGLPWWVTIATTTLFIRGLLFPIVLKTQRNADKMRAMKPETEALTAEMAKARKANDSRRLRELMTKSQELYRKNGLSPFSTLWGLTQAPVFISFFLALRAMAELPVPGFETGGIGFVKDLTIMDPTFILPIIASASMLAVMEMTFDMNGGTQQMTASMKTLFRVMMVVFIPITAQFPSGIFMYWVPTNIFTLLQFLALRNARVRQYFKLAPTKRSIAPSASAGMVPKPMSIVGAWGMMREARR
ncbi:Mitochondrial inner membrane protein oxa1l, partial [Irineochytrium annulatum]